MKYLFFIASFLGATSLHAQMIQKSEVTQPCTGFIKNEGQVSDQYGKANKKVAYLFAAGHFSIVLNTNGFSYQFFEPENKSPSAAEADLTLQDEDGEDDHLLSDERDIVTSRVDVTFSGANKNPEIIAENAIPGQLNYYASSDSKDAFTNVRSYRKIIYRNIYKGIDLEFLYNEQFTFSPLEYRFVLHARSDPSQIKMKYQGAGILSINKNGELSVGSTTGEVTERGLCAFEAKTGMTIPVNYKMTGSATVGFDLTTRSDNTIIIDPEIVWGTYFGGKGSEDFDTESEIKVDHEGKIVICGSTSSFSKVATTGAFQTTFKGIRDIFLAKFNSDGHSLEFATYFGGAGKDVAYAIDLDSSNNIMVGALCGSPDMATAGSYKSVMTGSSDALIAKFTPTGQLVWATYLGGSPDTDLEHVRSIQVMPNNQFYVTGFVSSPGSGTEGVYQPISGGGGDIFLARFDANGFLMWFTYYGGAGKDRAHSLTVVDGNIYMIGTVKTKNGMATPGAFRTKGKGPNEAIFAKFDTSGHLIWGTYFGGEGSEHGRGILLDHAGNIYIDGWTDSFVGIATPGTYLQTKDPTIQNGRVNDDGFVAKFTPNGQIIWSTYIGGEATEYVFNLIKDNDDNFYLCGKTGSFLRISTTGAIQASKGDQADGFVAKIDSNGNFLWGTYLGGEGIDQAYDLDLDPENNHLFINLATKSVLPTTTGAYKTTLEGGIDLAVFKITTPTTPGLCADNFEPNDSMIEATSIEVSNDSLFEGINAKIDGATDQDWFKVTLSDEEPNLNVSLSGLLTSINIQLYDANANLLAATSDTGTTIRQLTYSDSIGAQYFIYLAHDSSINESNGCYTLTAMKSDTAMNDKSTLAVDIYKPIALQIFPNPAYSCINIRMNAAGDGVIEESITDYLGHQTITKSVGIKKGINEWKQDVSKLPPGIYKLICRTGLYSVSHSFIITR